MKLLRSRAVCLWVIPASTEEILVKHVMSGGLRCGRVDGWIAELQERSGLSRRPQGLQDNTPSAQPLSVLTFEPASRRPVNSDLQARGGRGPGSSPHSARLATGLLGMAVLPWARPPRPGNLPLWLWL